MEVGGSLCRPDKSLPAPHRQFRGVGRGGISPVGVQKMRSDDRRHLDIAGALEVVRHGQVTLPALGQGEPPVGDFADQALDELVLAPFR